MGKNRAITWVVVRYKRLQLARLKKSIGCWKKWHHYYVNFTFPAKKNFTKEKKNSKINLIMQQQLALAFQRLLFWPVSRESRGKQKHISHFLVIIQHLQGGRGQAGLKGSNPTNHQAGLGGPEGESGGADPDQFASQSQSRPTRTPMVIEWPLTLICMFLDRLPREGHEIQTARPALNHQPTGNQ